jgi:leader peptidase (prepilin peptidase) / N-methyltransferase
VSFTTILSDSEWIVVAAAYGLIIGSFLNVVIHRLPIMMEREWAEGCRDMMSVEANEEPPEQDADHDTAVQPLSLIRPRSRCPSCGNGIRIRDNIPVLSYLLLRGKCRSCAAPIGIRYPLVEIACAVLSATVIWHFGPTIAGVASLLLTWALIALALIDADTQLLPDSITLPLLWLGLGFNLYGGFVSLGDAVIGAMAGYMSLRIVYEVFKLLTKKEGMGFGDFKLLAALGAWLGWQQLAVIILLSSVVGSIVGIMLITLRKHDQQTPIPFGPYLAAAGWLALLWGTDISGMYLSQYSAPTSL